MLRDGSMGYKADPPRAVIGLCECKKKPYYNEAFERWCILLPQARRALLRLRGQRRLSNVVELGRRRMEQRATISALNLVETSTAR